MAILPKAIVQKLRWDETTNIFINLDSMSGKITIEKIKED